MQPNQQDPQPQNVSPTSQASSPVVPSSTEPLPYQVPDYLKLDPITGQEKKSSKKVKLAVGGIAAAFLLIGSIVAGIVWLGGASERAFYVALQLSMSTKFIHRDITTNDQKSAVSTVITADSDFSNPASPQSKFSYSYKASGTDAKGGKLEASLSGDIVTMSGGYAGRITSPPLSWMENVVPNTWYKVKSSEQPTSDPDPLSLTSAVNNPLGVILTGNYSQDNQKTFLEFMRNNKVYTVTSMQSKTENGKTYDVFGVKVDYKQLGALNTLVNQTMKTTAEVSSVNSVNQVEVWADSQTHVVSKTVENISQGSSFSASTTTRFTYPDTLNISLPAGVKL